jgi:GDP-6-deoxy-D-talose 4-dehydrogenase
MRRALITGINGFTGRYLAAELRQHGWQAFGVGARSVQNADEQYAQADILDTVALRNIITQVKPQAVVHLAGVASPAHSDVDTLYKVNILGARSLLAAISDSGVEIDSVLLASSAYVYGNAREGVFDESSPVNPGNDYAVSKLAMEYVAKLWKDKLPITLVRPFNYSGVGQSESFLLAKIVGHFRRRESVIELGNLDVSRDFSDVRSVAYAYRRLLEVRPVGEVVNVCSGTATSLRQVLQMAELASGHSIDVRVNPAFVRANDVRELRGDPTKLRDLLGDWHNPPLIDTLRWMINSHAEA